MSDSIPFVQARNYTPTLGRKISLVILHSMESAEKPETAENVAAWFAGKDAPQASAHYLVDADSIVQCVKDKDIAWGAPGANSRGLHIEHAGRAEQRTEDWEDPYSAATLERSAELVAGLCAKYDIPAAPLGAHGVAGGGTGITTHAAVSLAFSTPGGHTDPGPGFPLDWYIGRVVANWPK